MNTFPSSPLVSSSAARRSSLPIANPSRRNPTTTPGTPKLMLNSITFPTPKDVVFERIKPVISPTTLGLPAFTGLSGQSARGTSA